MVAAGKAGVDGDGVSSVILIGQRAPIHKVIRSAARRPPLERTVAAAVRIGRRTPARGGIAFMIGSPAIVIAGSAVPITVGCRPLSSFSISPTFK